MRSILTHARFKSFYIAAKFLLPCCQPWKLRSNFLKRVYSILHSDFDIYPAGSLDYFLGKVLVRELKLECHINQLDISFLFLASLGPCIQICWPLKKATKLKIHSPCIYKYFFSFCRGILAAARRLLSNSPGRKFYWLASDGWGKQKQVVEGIEDFAVGAITVELESMKITGKLSFSQKCEDWLVGWKVVFLRNEVALVKVCPCPSKRVGKHGDGYCSFVLIV